MGAEGRGPKSGSLASAWRHRPFRYLLSSYAVSWAGDYIYTVALVAYIFNRTHSASWVAALALVRILPFALFGSIGGVIAGRFDRRKLMVGLDLIRAAVMGALVLGAALDVPLVFLLVLTFVSNAASTPYRAAVVSLTPDLVGEDDIAAANAAEAVVSQIAMFVGPAIGALLYAASSAEACFAFNGVTFLVSALLVARAVVRPSSSDVPASAAGEGSEEHEGPDESGGSGWIDEIKLGARSATRTPGVGVIVGLLMGVMFSYGFELVLYPLVAAERLGLGAEGAGYLMGAVGIGGLLIAPVSGRFGASRRPGVLLALSAVLLGGPLMLLSVVSVPSVAYALLLVEGAGNILLEVLAMTTLQRLLKGGDLARVSGFMDSGMGVATLAGAVLAPLVAQNMDLEWALLFGGAPLVILGIAGVRGLDSAGRRATAAVEDLTPIADRLAALGLFEGVGRGSLERMASALTEVSCPAGEAVVTENEPSDDLYVVVDGTLAVASSAATEAIPDLGPGDWFGEIGLLRHTARTATVTSSTPVTLWRIPGEEFADAVAGAGTSNTMHATLGLRLARTPALAGG